MYRRFHDRFGTAGVVLGVIALILALGGTALAAKGALTGKQKKEVEKIAKKYAGKPGAPGANGKDGTNGTNGKDGTNGTNGADGKSVAVTPIEEGDEECEERGGALVEQEGAASGTEVCNGAEGEQGIEGEPWTPESELPSGATETGTWTSGFIKDTTAYPGFFKDLQMPISFPIKLSEEDAANVDARVILPNGEEYSAEAEVPQTQCDGNAGAPSADPGNLCIYVGGGTVNAPSFPEADRKVIIDPVPVPIKSPDGTLGAVAPSGTILRALVLGQEIEVFGAWAVTAE